MDDHSSATRVTTGSQAANPDLWAESSLWWSPLSPPACAFDSRGPYHARPLFGIAPGGACHTVLVTKTVVGSYPTVSPSPQIRPRQALNTTAVFSLWRFPWGYPRRALPGTLPSWSPDFPRGLRPAVIQPSARGAAYAGPDATSTGKRWARSQARPASTLSTHPAAQGRNRSRNAASRSASDASG